MLGFSLASGNVRLSSVGAGSEDADDKGPLKGGLWRLVARGGMGASACRRFAPGLNHRHADIQ